MAHNARKILVLCVLVCLTALYAPITAAAEEQDAPNEEILQPQGLNYAGIHELKQLDSNLTGEGVKLAVISRSITYIDGEP